MKPFLQDMCPVTPVDGLGSREMQDEVAAIYTAGECRRRNIEAEGSNWPPVSGGGLYKSADKELAHGTRIRIIGEKGYGENS